MEAKGDTKLDKKIKRIQKGMQVYRFKVNNTRTVQINMYVDRRVMAVLTFSLSSGRLKACFQRVEHMSWRSCACTDCISAVRIIIFKPAIATIHSPHSLVQFGDMVRFVRFGN